ncbi:hypothetical protein PoB_000015100 [Plakobranchus ocellatus]|uniref:Uncharacterized protein n=1 Tax=Plakobranchus ocellatus TaxID=259542 RepID=A0AAV3XU93_9GAST|nr:hypothetical protein PoB_000015100 [Plakobranchus ocellatus]
MKKDYDLKARRLQYEVGDAVYVCDKASLKGAGAAAKRGPGNPVTTDVARVGNVAVIERKAPARGLVRVAIGDDMDRKDTPTTRGLERMG